MPSSHVGFVTRFRKSITSVLPDRFEEPVAGLTALSLHQHQRLVHERRQQIQDVYSLHASVCADRLGGLQGPPSGKHRQPPEQLPLCLREQVITPVDRCAQRLLAREHDPASSGEEAEPIIQPGGDLFHRQDIDPGRRQFDGERNAIQPLTDLRHGWSVFACDGKPWGGRHCSIEKEAHGLVLDEILEGREMANVGQGERGDWP